MSLLDHRAEIFAAALAFTTMACSAPEPPMGNKILPVEPESTAIPTPATVESKPDVCVPPAGLPARRAMADFHRNSFSTGLYFDDFNNLGNGAFLLQLEPGFPPASLSLPIPGNGFGMNTVIDYNGESLHVFEAIATNGQNGTVTSTWDGNFKLEPEQCNSIVAKWGGWSFNGVFLNGAEQAVNITQRAIPTPTIPIPLRNPNAA